MEQSATPPQCAVCGKAQDQVQKLIAAVGPAICDGCITAYGAALKQAFEEDARARAGTSELIAAEEMALGLIDALETSRAEQAERELLAATEKRLRGLRLVQAEEALYASGEAPQGSAEPPEEPLEERPPSAARHCPRCTGRLEELPADDGEPSQLYRCGSCQGHFEITPL